MRVDPPRSLNGAIYSPHYLATSLVAVFEIINVRHMPLIKGDLFF
jgi:hypothetical protein